MILIAALLALPLAAHAADIPLSVGTLHIPEGYWPKDGRADLVVHFHGTAERARTALEQSGKDAALVAVVCNGLSNAYATPFRKDPKLFGNIIHEALAQVAKQCGVDEAKLGRLVVSSFSAGYGAVREILKSTGYVSQITDLVLVDTVYAGYAVEDGHNVVQPNDMASFVTAAHSAVRGEMNFWLTYSQVVPPGYASTSETAHYLADKVGLKIQPAEGEDAPGLTLTAKADKGGFHIRGYEGDDGPAHMKHLYALGFFYAKTSLPDRVQCDPTSR